MPSQDGYYEALWPRSPRQSKVKPLAKRLDTLNGKTIAQVWDMVFRGDEVFEYLEEGIKARYPDVKFVSWKDFGSTHGSDERAIVAALPQKFKEAGIQGLHAMKRGPKKKDHEKAKLSRENERLTAALCESSIELLLLKKSVSSGWMDRSNRGHFGSGQLQG